mmetsp:Transcript_1584/g.3885  ORF Transcript_1584/g.3885 Transcript_1584/m.3885 type:complete len:281 (+) Transcript_1584:540-1382(+)
MWLIYLISTVLGFVNVREVPLIGSQAAVQNAPLYSKLRCPLHIPAFLLSILFGVDGSVPRPSCSASSLVLTVGSIGVLPAWAVMDPCALCCTARHALRLSLLKRGYSGCTVRKLRRVHTGTIVPLWMGSAAFDLKSPLADSLMRLSMAASRSADRYAPLANFSSTSSCSCFRVPSASSKWRRIGVWYHGCSMMPWMEMRFFSSRSNILSSRSRALGLRYLSWLCSMLFSSHLLRCCCTHTFFIGSVTPMELTLSPSKGNFPMRMTHSSTPIAHTSAFVPS